MKDNIVEEVRQTRERLIKQYGGIDGYFKHLRALDRSLAARSKSRHKTRRARHRNMKAGK